MKKVSLISLGCDKNLVDSENILGLLEKSKYQLASNNEDADILIINTCGFISDAKKESIDKICECIETGKKVVVTGCLAQRYYNELKAGFSDVENLVIIPIRDYYRFNEILSTLDDELKDKSGVSDDYRYISTGDYSAYIKIGEGCSNKCSYCAIPLIRGEFYSKPMDKILKEARLLAEKGYKELIVLEQDTTKYGIDLKSGENIVVLLKELLKIQGFEYIRLLYLYPDEVTDELIDLIASEPRLTPYFDIPIQHSEDKIILAMNRRGNKEYLRNLFKKIRQRVPNAILRTTIMVGFPGETKKDFENLKKFISEVKFNHLGCFAFSREDETPSYNFSHQVRESTKQKRLAELMQLQKDISYENNQAFIGKTMEGLIVGQEAGGFLKLRSYFNAPGGVDGIIIFKPKKKHKEGDKVKIKITKAFTYDLMGEEVIDWY